VDWTTVWTIAKRMGTATARRVAYLLIHTGHEQALAGDLPALNVKGAATPLDRSNGYGMTRTEATRDPQTGVLVNVPTEQLRGWLDPASLG
jgi:hypothetical protein